MQCNRLKRRDFITLLGGGAVMWPLAASAQQPAMPLAGFLHGGAASSNSHLVEAFRRGLGETSFVEGRNVMIEYRWAEGHYDRLAPWAADLVQRSAAVIFGGSPPAARAAKAASTATPVVFVTGDDPIKSGLVEAINRPEGHVSGVSFFSGSQLGAKHAELLHELIPSATTIALLVNPANATQADEQTKLTEIAAHKFGMRLHIVNASTESELGKAFASLAEQRAEALIIGGDPFFTSQRNRLIDLAARHALPAVYNLRAFVEAGGLMSYGSSITDAYQQAGIYTGRILKGVKPFDLPVMLPTTFELVINLKTAKALGIAVPQALQVAATDVIE
jgi:putative ABC transport system substrate-binding protein